MKMPVLSQIPIVLHKEPEYTEQGTAVCEPDGKQKYRCGFRIGGGIDQDPSKSPQGYPDKVSCKWDAIRVKLRMINASVEIYQ